MTLSTPAHAAAAVHDRPPSVLPRWPLSALLVGFPLWWALGVVDFVWVPMAAIMGVLLLRLDRVRAPRGFGLWLLFLAWSGFSIVTLRGGGDLFGFVYRYSIYVSVTVLFLYIYNGRPLLNLRYVTGCLTSLWVATVAGGYLGIFAPSALLRTPMSQVLPPSLLNNELVNFMVIRRFSQFNPDSFLQVAPRPAAPFLYTNNWGNVYSLLLPFVVVYLFESRGSWQSKAVAVLLPLSTVPAMLTLNRGMFLGIGVSMLYVAFRLALRKQIAPIIGLVLAGLLAGLIFTALPVEERLGNRLSDTAERTSNDTRALLYAEALESVPRSPLLGHGGPYPSKEPQAAPVGTQGQFWMLLVSHGPFATALFLLFFLTCFFRSWRRTDPVGLAANTVILVALFELTYYGVVPYGLPIMMIAAALAVRDENFEFDSDGPRVSERMV